MQRRIRFNRKLPDGFTWFNEPANYRMDKGLHIQTSPQTDFWQRTHYGFQNDNGHALLTELPGDFSMETHVRFRPQTRYDQCGLLVRVNAENWIKLSTEYETADLSMLGSVVTNLGYSDWATIELADDPAQMWYRISKDGPDFLLQASADGQKWQQLRIAHLHAEADSLRAGVYACSPLDGRFACTFSKLLISENSWKAE